jgi:parallel beta-helix repeat protein
MTKDLKCIFIGLGLISISLVFLLISPQGSPQGFGNGKVRTTISSSQNLLENLTDACHQGNVNLFACKTVNNTIQAIPMPEGIEVGCEWNDTGSLNKCTPRVVLNTSLIVNVLEQSSLIDNVDFIQLGQILEEIILFAEPFLEHYVHVIANASEFPGNESPEFWMRVYNLSEVNISIFNLSQINPAEIAQEQIEQIEEQYSGYENITLGMGIAPDLSVVKNYEDFYWNLTIPYNTSEDFIGVVACNGTILNGNCSCSGNWINLSECPTCGNCSNNTYSIDCPSFGLVTVYGADPMPVYGKTPSENCTNVTDNLYINEDTTLCYGFYNIPDNSPNGVLIINSSNVILNCNNATLNGTDSGVGIYSDGYDNVTIENCTVKNYGSFIIGGVGIYLRFSENSVIKRNTLQYNYDGIRVYRSSNIKIINNTVSNNDGWDSGIHLEYVNNSIISGNNCSNNSVGISLFWSFNNTLNRNKAENNSYYGIYLHSSSNNTLTNNIANNNQKGLYFEDASSTKNIVNSNTFCFNSVHDIHDADSNSGDGNTCNSSKLNNWKDQGTSGCTYACTSLTETFSILLQQGWNLISIPLKL